MVKINARNVFLSLFFALAIGFSFSTEASAHPYKDYTTHSMDIDINAEDINAGDMDDIKKLVRHVAKHIVLIQTESPAVLGAGFSETEVFLKLIRKQGVFNNGDDIYPISANHRRVIISHGRHQQDLYGQRYDDSVEPIQTLFGPDVPEFSDSVEPKCVTYGNENRVACAVRLSGGGIIMAQALTTQKTSLAYFLPPTAMVSGLLLLPRMLKRRRIRR